VLKFNTLQVTFLNSTRNFSVRPLKSQRVKKKKTNQTSSTKGPHPAAILAVLSIGVSAYFALVKSRGNQTLMLL